MEKKSDAKNQKEKRESFASPEQKAFEINFVVKGETRTTDRVEKEKGNKFEVRNKDAKYHLELNSNRTETRKCIYIDFRGLKGVTR